METLEEKLKRLVAEACASPPGSPKRQKLLTQIIRLCTGKLWRENTSYYKDALQQTWLYFCRNICESNTATAYDPLRGSVISWLNVYLKFKLRDFYTQERNQQAKTLSQTFYQSASGDSSEALDLVDTLAAEPDIPPILDTVRIWAETDKSGELCRTHIQGHPNVTCQLLILKRLPPEVGWKELAVELGLTVSTLSSFYQRQCIPRLRKFAEQEGYL